MASATVIKYPDGRTESRNILTSFEKNGTSVIVFETDKVDNGHKVVGVSYLADGMYQNIVDPDKWNEAKGYLVDILHDRMTENDYRLVPSEVLVTADPYHPLGLRDENLDKMISDYEKFVAANQVVETQSEAEVETINDQSVATDEISEVANEEDIVADIPILNGAVNVEAEENVMDIVDEVINPFENNQVAETPAVEETPQVEEIVPVSPVGTQAEVVNEQPVVVGEIPEVAPVQESVVAPEVNIQPEISEPIVQNIQPVIEDPVSMIAPESNSNVVEPISIINQAPVEPVLNESPVLDIPQTQLNNEPIEVAPIQESVVAPEVNIQPEFVEPVVQNVQPVMEDPVSMVAPEPVSEVSGSAVKDSYENTAASIIQQMRELTEEYFKKMEEMRAEISRNLEEAKGINELSKQTFDRAQAMAPVQNTEPVLELTKVA